MKQKVIAITGANRGLGLALARRIATTDNSFTKVIICVRDVEKGKQVLENFYKEVKPRTEMDIAPLDMNNEDSMGAFCDLMKKDYGQIHALINNAGILIKDSSITPEENLEKTASTNLFGVISLSERFVQRDLIEKHGKILGISSKLATSSFIKDEKLKKLISEVDSTQNINTAYLHMMNAIKSGNIGAMFVPKFPFAEYSVLKRLLSRYYGLLSQRHEIKERDIFVATICPGWCKTDMGGEMASNSVESGTDITYDLLNQNIGATHPLQGKLIYAPNTGIDV